ncbi:MAG TPA: 50S ribosomal protein L25 [Vicinamibacterales bacterium]|nr:50S ribosomal protein L25 [Vicinamibacterales bacterium]
MEAVLEAIRRDQRGRNEAGRLRREGRIPAVLYGGATATAESLAVNPKELMRILHSDSGVNTLISLKLEGLGDTRVLVREYQIDPVTRKLLHADFYRVAMDKLLEVTVPIHLTGEAKGIKAQGAIVDFVHREIVIEVLPADIPENITVDVTELMLHDGIRVRDLPTNPKWKALSDPDMLIVHLVAMKVEEEPAPADAAVAAAAPATPAEPEVIKKGKVEKPEEEKE